MSKQTILILQKTKFNNIQIYALYIISVYLNVFLIRFLYNYIININYTL